ncbi:MAG: hypothetical protein AB1465_03715 [Patescibacteria group bacterium]
MKIFEKFKENETWFMLKEIPKNHYFMIGLPVLGFIKEYPKFGAGNFIKKQITETVLGTTNLWFIEKELDKSSGYIGEKMTKNPTWAERTIKKVIYFCRQFFKISEKFRKINVEKKSNKELIKLLEAAYPSHYKHQSIAHSITWIAEAKKARFSKYLLNYLNNLIKNKNLKINTASAFSLLTTPLKSSFIGKEEIDFYKIGIEIQKNKKLKNLFRNKNLEKIKNNLPRQNQKVYQKILTHFNKFCWLPFDYIGPAYDLNYFLSKWRDLNLQNFNFKKEYYNILKKKEK